MNEPTHAIAGLLFWLAAVAGLDGLYYHVEPYTALPVLVTTNVGPALALVVARLKVSRR